MVKAGVIKSPSMWPKMIWIKTFLRYNLDFYVNEIGGYLPLNPSKKLEKKLRKAKENMNVVTYCGINHHLEPKVVPAFISSFLLTLIASSSSSSSIKRAPWYFPFIGYGMTSRCGGTLNGSPML